MTIRWGTKCILPGLQTIQVHKRWVFSVFYDVFMIDLSWKITPPWEPALKDPITAFSMNDAGLWPVFHMCTRRKAGTIHRWNGWEFGRWKKVQQHSLPLAATRLTGAGPFSSWPPQPLRIKQPLWPQRSHDDTWRQQAAARFFWIPVACNPSIGSSTY